MMQSRILDHLFRDVKPFDLNDKKTAGFNYQMPFQCVENMNVRFWYKADIGRHDTGSHSLGVLIKMVRDQSDADNATNQLIANLKKECRQAQSIGVSV